MNAKQAIERLQLHKEWGFAEDTIDAINVAIDALEKGVAKKPENLDSAYIPELMADRIYGECPTCGEIVVETGKRCIECGQVLNWD